MFICPGKHTYVHDIGHMKFHNYLEQLFGSRVSISLVRALINYKGKIFTIRKLAEVANVSPSEAAVVIQQLEKHGIVKLQPVGRSYLVSPNDRSYVLNKILKPIVKAEEETLDELVSVLKKHLSSENIISAVLFGSVPGKYEREDSDVDMLLISNDFDAASIQASKAQEEVSLIFHSRLSPLILGEKELKAKKTDRLIRLILEKHVTISGKDLKDLVGEG